MATDSRKRLALAVIDFLSTSLKDGTLQPEDADSIEIASNCIAECFHVDPTDSAATHEALGGQNLLAIYGVYEKLKGKSTASTQGPSSADEGKPSTPTLPKEGETGGPTSESERLKGVGNVAMQKKDYPNAIDSYTKALEIAPLNPIYLSNRAAAFSANSQHELAKNDAELATATDPKYTKAWSRLGLSRFALGDAKGSMEAYSRGIEAEGTGGSEAMKKGYETAKRKVEEEGVQDEDMDDDDDDVGASTARSAPAGGAGGGMPDLAGLASMLGGGAGGGGGMPDLSSIMQNPMMRQMAQNVMSNPDMMSGLMNNPRLREMAGSLGGGGRGAGGAEGGASGGGGGGMPDLSAMMNDPAIAEMARNFMGGMGGAGAGRGAGGGSGTGQ
ncbi:Small glutamine-rich tetratricopeptide repeat-containing protein 2 [Extremus antarcticus]|uniref:Small glutamine-rich tetratricopeptide repeat-containing protein 2 n=1 Tax=Extremus antarcticus TaxID=702011 RepID=A0AAJ0DNT3_9PEZI|nr:Small glutamine-rich tetratricopeptide repeat-containing protein 2 [Extremus antarcticus]